MATEKTIMDNPVLTQMALDPNDRPKYSKEQVQIYLDRIRLPQKYRDSPVFSEPSLARTKEHGLPLIQAIVRWHTSNVPFEDMELHYSAQHRISLEPKDLYWRFGETGVQYGRGGRCMETNGFFGTFMRSLGYNVRNGGSRVSRMMYPDALTREQGQTYDPWDHMVNFVKFDKEWWLVDVGMGSMGPNMPLPLEDGFETVSVAPRKIRLRYRPIAEHAQEDDEDAQKMWCFDVCHHPQENADENKWIPTYCFTMTEFLPQDYEMMSWFTSTSPRCFFMRCIMCTKMIMDEETEEIIGDYSLFNDSVRKTVKGNREVAKMLETEQDRIDALKEIFNIELTEEQKAGITPDLKLK